jgi:hypothetical protein
LTTSPMFAPIIQEIAEPGHHDKNMNDRVSRERPQR